MCRAAKRARQTSVYIYANLNNAIFTHTYIRRACAQTLHFHTWHSLQIGHLTYQIWRKSPRPIPRYEPSKFVWISSYFSSSSSSFRTKHKKWNKTSLRDSNYLKIGTLLEFQLWVLHKKFWTVSIKIGGARSDYRSKFWTIFRHAYRVNGWTE